MLFRIKTYIKFLWHSKNEHGVHSPFVYNLLTKCFYDKKQKTHYPILSQYRKALLQNKDTIKITNGISSKRAQLLYRITEYFQPSTILEIGTSVGLATSALSFGNPNASIVTLENYPQNFQLPTSSFQLPASNFQLIYFNGKQSKKDRLDYFGLLLPTITNETVWIFDNIHWSLEMEETWDIIKTHPKVTVTIDTFRWGLVFFRYEQPKEHFVIRV